MILYCHGSQRTWVTSATMSPQTYSPTETWEEVRSFILREEREVSQLSQIFHLEPLLIIYVIWLSIRLRLIFKGSRTQNFTYPLWTLRLPFNNSKVQFDPKPWNWDRLSILAHVGLPGGAASPRTPTSIGLWPPFVLAHLLGLIFVQSSIFAKRRKLSTSVDSNTSYGSLTPSPRANSHMSPSPSNSTVSLVHPESPLVTVAMLRALTRDMKQKYGAT